MCKHVASVQSRQWDPSFPNSCACTLMINISLNKREPLAAHAAERTARHSLIDIRQSIPVARACQKFQVGSFTHRVERQGRPGRKNAADTLCPQRFSLIPCLRRWQNSLWNGMAIRNCQQLNRIGHESNQRSKLNCFAGKLFRSGDKTKIAKYCCVRVCEQSEIASG